jgi:hypothetical protein
VLHAFCATYTSSICQDGSGPVSRLIIDTSGKLYGTTVGGGANNGGKLTYAGAESGTPYDGTSVMAGTTFAGGDMMPSWGGTSSTSGSGVVYEVTP